MTGAYLRVFREKWKNIEVEHLSNKEREEIFISRTPEEIIRWLNLVCENLSNLEPKKSNKDNPYNIDYERQTKIEFDENRS